MAGWLDQVNADPRDWLLEGADPAVRAQALQRLLDRSAQDPEVVAARRAAMATDPIAGILAAQEPDGHWGKPGPGYTPKYVATVWQVIFLDQLGADGTDPRVRAGCAYVLAHTLAVGGGFGCSGTHRTTAPPASSVLHCLNGNLVAALISLGWADHEGVRASIDWACRAILGGTGVPFHRSGTAGPGFACGANEGRPCAWGANKELRALARIPPAERTTEVAAAIDAGVALLLSVDPVSADYPRPAGDAAPSAAWWRPSFPLGYTSDVLETLEVLAALGPARDRRLDGAYEWLLAGADRDGRWPSRRIMRGPMHAPVEPTGRGRASKWVTLRAAGVLRARFGD
jgi:hypothetical protein